MRELCTDSIAPSLAPVIERLWLPTPTGKDVAVIKVEVSRSLFVHKSPGGYLHRVGSAKREMAPEFLARLFQQRSQARIILGKMPVETTIFREQQGEELPELLAKEVAEHNSSSRPQ